MTSVRYRCVVVAVAVTMSGCAVGPDFHPVFPPPVDSFTSPAGGAGDRVAGRVMRKGGEVPPQWWELFKSPSLNALVRETVEFNADLRAAEAAVRVAQANALAQRGALFPVVTGSFDANRQKTPTGTLDTNSASGASIYSLYTPQVSVSFVPDVWGGTRRQIESLEAQVEAQMFQREALYVTLASNVATAAIEQARLRGQITITKRLIRSQTDLLALLQKQYDSGQIGLPDVTAQQTALAQTRLLLPPLDKQLAQQTNLIAVLRGRLPAQDGGAPLTLGDIHLPRELPLSLPADLVRQRPDIRAAEATLHAANAQIGVAIANRLPQLTISGNVGSTASNIGQLFNPGTGFWLIAGNAAQTIFDAGTLRYKQRAAEEATTQALEQYRSVTLAAFQNVANVLQALQADARAIEYATTAERTANRNLGLIRRQIEEGQFSIAVLLAAQQAQLQTSLARVDAQAALLSDTVALFQALGGGWWNKPPPIIALRE